MAEKYHISPTTGNPNRCYANTKPCPIGGEGEHYPTKESARKAFESSNSQTGIPKLSRRKPESESLLEDRVSFKSHSSRPSQEALVVSREGDTAVLRTPEGYHWRARLGVDGWEPEGSNSRITNPGNYPIPTTESVKGALVVPDGFKLTETTEKRRFVAGGEVTTLSLESDDTVISMVFDAEGSSESYVIASGHVSFDTAAGRRTFDRLGVEDSFYIDNPAKDFTDSGDPNVKLNETIKEFIEVKIPASRERAAVSEKVPGTDLLISPAQKEVFRSTGRVTLAPSGFGTQYTFSRTNIPGAKTATEAQRKLFGMKKLYVKEEFLD
jgi:hypothetical protein